MSYIVELPIDQLGYHVRAQAYLIVRQGSSLSHTSLYHQLCYLYYPITQWLVRNVALSIRIVVVLLTGSTSTSTNVFLVLVPNICTQYFSIVLCTQQVSVSIFVDLRMLSLPLVFCFISIAPGQLCIIFIIILKHCTFLVLNYLLNLYHSNSNKFYLVLCIKSRSAPWQGLVVDIQVLVPVVVQPSCLLLDQVLDNSYNYLLNTNITRIQSVYEFRSRPSMNS